MTNTFTNKKKRRYYYYKCLKVVRDGKTACSLKEVNAEKLEEFIFQNLERISQDKNYVESLVFKTLYSSPGRKGFELLGSSEKSTSERVLHVLQRYVSDFKKGSQLEKQLVMKRTFEKIVLRKETLEVILIIEDREKLKLTGGLSHRMGWPSASVREGVSDLNAPACNTGSEVNLAESLGFEPRDPFYQVSHLAGDCNRPLCQLS